MHRSRLGEKRLRRIALSALALVCLGGCYQIDVDPHGYVYRLDRWTGKICFMPRMADLSKALKEGAEASPFALPACDDLARSE